MQQARGWARGASSGAYHAASPTGATGTGRHLPHRSQHTHASRWASAAAKKQLLPPPPANGAGAHATCCLAAGGSSCVAAAAAAAGSGFCFFGWRLATSGKPARSTHSHSTRPAVHGATRQREQPSLPGSTVPCENFEGRIGGGTAWTVASSLGGARPPGTADWHGARRFGTSSWKNRAISIFERKRLPCGLKKYTSLWPLPSNRCRTCGTQPFNKLRCPPQRWMYSQRRSICSAGDPDSVDASGS